MTWMAVGWVSHRDTTRGKNGRTRGSCEEDGGADGFEEIEFLAHLYSWNEEEKEKKTENIPPASTLCQRRQRLMIERDEQNRSITMA